MRDFSRSRNEWQLAKLGDVAEIVMGQSPPGLTVLDWNGQPLSEDGLPFIQGNAEFGSDHPEPKKWCTKPIKIAEYGDTLISVRAPVGETNRANNRVAIGRGLAAIRFTHANPDYGWHIVNHARREFQRVAQGSTFEAVGRDEVRCLPIDLPSVSEQLIIAAVLDSIDKAIKRAEAVISATECLRDALVYELLSRGLRGWHTDWRAVPGLGTIPSDWRIVRLGDVYEIQLGKMLSPRARLGRNPQPYLTNRHVQWGHFDLSALPVMDFDECEMQKFELRSGDLLVCEGGDVGRSAVWEEQIPNCYYQKALHRLRPVDGDSIPRFMLAVLMSFHQRGTLLEHSERTSISHLTRTRLLQMRVPHPTRPEQIGIADTVQAVGNRVDCMRIEKQKLQQFKLSLANSLFSGQTRTVPPLSSHGA